MVNNIVEGSFPDRVLIKVGNSFAVTIPESAAVAKGFVLGLPVDVTLRCDIELEDIPDKVECEARLKTYSGYLDKGDDLTWFELGVIAADLGLLSPDDHSDVGRLNYIRDIKNSMDAEITQATEDLDTIANFGTWVDEGCDDDEFDYEKNPDIVKE